MTKPTQDHQSALLDVRLLRLFDLLYETRSVTRAAEQLGQAQPTVSIWLNRLRHDLGDPLFVRTAGGMEPTPRADALIGVARSAIETLSRLTERVEAFDPVLADRRFRICMTDASHVTLLPRLLAHLHSAAPKIRIEALHIDDRTAHHLQAGEADLALGLIPELESGFFQQTLYEQDWVCLVSPLHPRIGERFGLARYRAERHVGIVTGTGHELLRAALAAQGIDRTVFVELPGFLGLVAILQSTELIATLPRHTGETLAKAGGLRVLPCPFRIPSFTVKQHWHVRYHDEPGCRWLRATCADLFQTRRLPQG